MRIVLTTTMVAALLKTVNAEPAFVVASATESPTWRQRRVKVQRACARYWPGRFI